MGVDHQGLNLTDRKRCAGLLPHDFDDVYRRQGIVCKINGLFRAGLTVEHTGKLVTVPEAEFNLKTGVVYVVDIFIRHRFISREVKSMCAIGKTVYYKTYLAFQGVTPDHKPVCLALFGVNVETFLVAR